MAPSWVAMTTAPPATEEPVPSDVPGPGMLYMENEIRYGLVPVVLPPLSVNVPRPIIAAK